jgi:hypothetical protein
MFLVIIYEHRTSHRELTESYRGVQIGDLACRVFPRPLMSNRKAGSKRLYVLR